VLRVDKATVCGLSMGGYIALNAIANYPGRFEALVLADTTCKAETTKGKEKMLSTITEINDNGVSGYVGESVKNMFAPLSFTTKESDINAVRHMILTTTIASLTATLLALATRKKTGSRLIAIQVPVLILVGVEDKITPPEAAMYMHVQIKKSVLQLIDNAAHLSNLENPDEFNAQLKSFLASTYKVYSDIKAREETSFFREIRNKVAVLLSFKPI